MRKSITKIRAAGVKVPHFDHDLSAVTIFHGPNAAGKSARLIAAEIGLTGRHEASGKTNGATFGLCCGTKLSVELDTTLGSVARVLEQKGASIKATMTPEEFPETPVPMINPSVYLEKSEKERVKYISSLIDLRESEWTGERICNEIRAISPDEPTKPQIEALLAIATDIDESDRERHDIGQSIQEWVDQLIAEQSGKDGVLAKARATVDRLKKFGRAQVQMQSTDDAGPTRNVDDELMAATERLGKLRAELAAEKGKAEASVKDAEERERLKAVLAQPDNADQIKGLEELIAQLEKQCSPTAMQAAYSESAAAEKAMDAAIAGNDNHAEQRKAKAELADWLAKNPDKSTEIGATEQGVAELTSLVQNHVSTWRDDLQAMNKIETAIADLQRLAKSSDAIVARLQIDAESEKAKVCPCCGNTGMQCQSTAVRIEGWLAQAETASTEAARHRETAAAAEGDLAKAKQKVESAKVADDQQQKNIGRLNSWRLALSDLQAYQKERNRKALAFDAPIENPLIDLAPFTLRLDEAGKKLAELRASQESLSTSRTFLAAAKEARQTRRDAQSRLDVLAAKPAPDPLKAGDLESEIGQLAENVEALMAMQKRHAAAQQEQARAAQSLAELEEAEAKLAMLKLVSAKLSEIQAKMVEESFAPLLDVVNAVCSGVMAEKVVYHDGEIGKFRNGKWVSHAYFSGMEKAVTYAGISAALCAKAPIRVLIMDELGRFIGPNPALFIETILDLIERGIIDQFIGAAPYAEPFQAIQNPNLTLIAV